MNVATNLSVALQELPELKTKVRGIKKPQVVKNIWRKRLVSLLQRHRVSFSGLSKNMIPAAWNLLLRVAASNKWDDLACAWQAQLIMPGDCVREVGKDEAWFVLHTSRFGFLGWPCNVDKMVSRFRICLQHHMPVQPKWQVVVEAKAWLIFVLRVVPPIASVLYGKAPAMALASLAPVPALTRVAKLGFKGVPPAYINKLMSSYRAAKAEVVPKTLVEKLIWLMKCIVPKITSEEIAEALKHRDESLLQASKIGADSELADSVYDSSDKKLMKEAADRIASEVGGKAAIEEALRQGSKYLEVLGCRPLPILKKTFALQKTGKKVSVDWDKMMEVHTARKVLPPVKGCTLQKWVERSTWIAFYPDVLPASRSRTWGKKFMAVRICSTSRNGYIIIGNI